MLAARQRSLLGVLLGALLLPPNDVLLPQTQHQSQRGLMPKKESLLKSSIVHLPISAFGRQYSLDISWPCTGQASGSPLNTDPAIRIFTLTSCSGCQPCIINPFNQITCQMSLASSLQDADMMLKCLRNDGSMLTRLFEAG